MPTYRMLLMTWLPILLASSIYAAQLPSAMVERVEVPRLHRLDGIVEAVNQTTVSAQTSGQIEEVRVDVEDYVTKGDVIAIISNTEHRARVAEAKANLRATQARLQDAQKNYKRISDVYEKKLVAKSELDKATANLSTARAELEAANAALTQAKEQLTYTEIRAPYTGIVTKRHIQVGEIAQPGSPIMSGIALEQLRVLVDVPQSLIPAVRKIGKAWVFIDDNTKLEVKKITIFPFADLGSNSFRVRLELPEGVADLFPGMYVKAAFVTGTEQSLVIPASAVVQRSEVTAVYVLDEDERLNFRHLRLGRNTGTTNVTVLAGLKAGERVVTDPVQAVAAFKAQRQFTQTHGPDHE